MTNEFLEAAKSSKKDSSQERYEKLKKEEAGTSGDTPAEKRFQELKEKAKREFVQKERERKMKKQEKETETDEDKDPYVTY